MLTLDYLLVADYGHTDVVAQLLPAWVRPVGGQ
jgi:hypothetical protein